MTQLFFSNLKLKKLVFPTLIFSFISLLQFFLLIKIIDNGNQVSIRDLLFTTFVQENNLDKIKETLSEINYKIPNKFENDFFLASLDQKLQNLIKLIENVKDVDKKVEMLLNNFSPSFNLDIAQCNQKVDLIYNINSIFTTGLGCCSDYAKTSISLLNILGIKAREVNNYRHTSIEYYNKDKWIWIDPSYRVFAYKGEDTNNKLSQFELFSANIGESRFYQFADINLLDFKTLNQIYHHKPSQYGSISYSLTVVNNNFRDQLIDFGIHKSLIDLVYLITGINKGKLTIVPNGNNFIFSKIAQFFSYFTILIIILTNLLITKFIIKKLNIRNF
ncbi:transglutaminase domain-containing protein [Alphaproteobacteria bacterium]|nr:transglutaminase domain-containing protein [Alphaproteobacteria bacterium]